jgi:hypothetical protein
LFDAAQHKQQKVPFSEIHEMIGMENPLFRIAFGLLVLCAGNEFKAK